MLLSAPPPRRQHDLYISQPSLIDAALAKVSCRPCSILDVGAGDGRWGQAARRLWPSANISGVEIRPLSRPAAFDGWVVGSFPETPVGGPFDLIIGNPPFSRADEIVAACRDLLTPHGELLFLLKLAFLEGQERGDGLFAQWPPARVWVSSKRQSFNADGKGTGFLATAVYHWRKPFRGEPRLGWLKETNGT
jgi:hypothetical protein